MTDKISFDLVSPERLVLSEEADMVTIPGSEGDMGVMAGHAPVITTLRPGFIAVSGGKDADTRFVVLGGFAEVTATKITVLAEEAIAAAEFDGAALDARIAVANESVAKAVTDSEKAARQVQLDGLQQLRNVL
jgi:F-type H+-transporting ATPase subunit epsilon